MVTRICTIPGIKHIYGDEITCVSREFHDLVQKTESQDEQKFAAVEMLLTVKMGRCETASESTGGGAHSKHAGKPIVKFFRALRDTEKSEEGKNRSVRF